MGFLAGIICEIRGWKSRWSLRWYMIGGMRGALRWGPYACASILFGCSGGVQPKLELLGCIFLCAQAPKLELLLCLIFVAQEGCNRDWSSKRNWGSPFRKLGQDESPADHFSGDSLCPKFCIGLPQFLYRFAPIFVSVCPNFFNGLSQFF